MVVCGLQVGEEESRRSSLEKLQEQPGTPVPAEDPPPSYKPPEPACDDQHSRNTGVGHAVLAETVSLKPANSLVGQTLRLSPFQDERSGARNYSGASGSFVSIFLMTHRTTAFTGVTLTCVHAPFLTPDSAPGSCVRGMFIDGSIPRSQQGGWPVGDTQLLLNECRSKKKIST